MTPKSGERYWSRPVLIPCDTCQSEGRILTNDGGPDDVDHGPCMVCEGAGMQLIPSEPAAMEDLDGPL